MSIGCAPGTHAALVELIRQHVPHRAGVLDIGAHSGALLARLQDAGFSDLRGTDLDLTRFLLKDVPIQRVDLNTDFAQQFTRKFNLICCTDVIEHLDSPRHFLKQARQLLRDDGYLALSIPNVAFWEGRLKFLLRGELWGFGDRNYRLQRHISPMTMDQMRLTMNELGFSIVAARTAGSFAGTVRKLAFTPLWLALRAVGGSTALGECLIFLARKAPLDAELTQPKHYQVRWQRSAQMAGAGNPSN